MVVVPVVREEFDVKYAKIFIVDRVTVTSRALTLLQFFFFSCLAR
jgi:hypothetical protein